MDGRSCGEARVEERGDDSSDNNSGGEDVRLPNEEPDNVCE